MKKDSKQQMKMCTIFMIVMLLIDQVTKIIACKFFNCLQTKTELKDNGYYIIMSLMAIIIIYRFISNENSYIKKYTRILLSLGVAGILGNTIDRLVNGYVMNFIKIHEFELNLAYIYIIIAWIGMVTLLTKNSFDMIKNKKKGNIHKNNDNKN